MSRHRLIQLHPKPLHHFLIQDKAQARPVGYSNEAISIGQQGQSNSSEIKGESGKANGYSK